MPYKHDYTHLDEHGFRNAKALNSDSQTASYAIALMGQNFINRQLLPLLQHLGLRAAGMMTIHKASFNVENVGDEGKLNWVEYKFATHMSDHDLTIRLSNFTQHAPTFVERGTPFETDRITEAAIDMSVDNASPISITKSVSRAVEIASNTSLEASSSLHWDVTVGNTFGEQGQEVNEGVTELVNLSASVGGNYQKTVGESTSNVVTKYLSDTVVVPAYSRYRILGTYDKVNIEVPYTMHYPLDFTISIMNLERKVAGVKTMYDQYVLDHGDHINLDADLNDVAFDNITTLVEYFRRGFKSSNIDVGEHEQEFDLWKRVMKDGDFKYYDGDDELLESFLEDPIAWLNVVDTNYTGQSLKEVVQTLREMLDFKHTRTITETGKFTYNDASDVSLTVKMIGEYDSSGNLAPIEGQEAENAFKPNWNGAHINSYG